MAVVHTWTCVLLLVGYLVTMFGSAEPKLMLKTKAAVNTFAGQRVRRDAKASGLQSDDPFPYAFCYCNTFATVGSQCNPNNRSAPCNCLVNFRGARCDSCTPGYWGFPDCLPCNCNSEGATNLVCNQATGRCPCRSRIRGKKCNLCPLGHYDFPRCKPCHCSTPGSHSFLCDEQTGQCPCRDKIAGRRCDRCLWGFYYFPDCWPCDCDALTTKDEICDNTGTCTCKANFQGPRCRRCMTGHYGFPLCVKCACSSSGFGTCGQYGECICRRGYTGRTCESCADGYYGFPHCTSCGCDRQGSTSQSCDQTTGKCVCKTNVIGNKCDMCAKDLVSFPACKQCSCNPAGTRALPGQHSVGCFGAKQSCMCKMNVEGTQCDRCRFGYYNFTASNPSGCSSCGCSTRGAMAGIRGCHVTTGRCDCKTHVTGAKCATCRDGFYQLLSHDIFGCRECRCNPGGSYGNICHKGGGQCKCRPNIHGKHCNKISSSAGVYIPTLYHIQAELEDGLEADGFPVLSGSERARVPGFSGAGYVVPPENTDFTVDINVPRTSTYRLVFRYSLDLYQPVTVHIRLSLKGVSSPTHTIATFFQPTVVGGRVRAELYTVLMNRKKVEVELSNGTWTVAMRSRSSKLLMDYVTLLPEEYYKASILQRTPTEPCLAHAYYAKHCSMYTYFTDNNTVTVPGIRGFLSAGGLKYFRDDSFDLRSPGFGYIAALGQAQVNVFYYVRVPRPGDYVLVVQYFQPQRIVHRIDVYRDRTQGVLEAQPCQYQFACKQVVVNDRRQVMTFALSRDMYKNKISLVAFSAANIGVITVTAIPKENWNIMYLKPFLRCSSHRHKCETSSYEMPRDAVWLLPDAPSADSNKIKTPLKGVVKSYGQYHMIVHYKQPSRLQARGSVRITSGITPLTADVTFEFCATDSGCRVEVQRNGNVISFSAGRVFLDILTAKETTVDYVLLVPSASYSPSLLQLHRKGAINAFMKHCSKDSFHISPHKRQDHVCRNAVFTLTMHFNGALSKCSCDPRGASSPVCNQFGGQCRCIRNVVGRRCDRCMISYTGFPSCRRCDCSPIGSVSPDCDVNGRCTCSVGFGGRKCNRCASSGYYGYPNCKACSCNTHGSLSMFCGGLGQCQCRQSFQGLKCDQCRVGYYDFPACKQCNCNPAGIRLLPGQQNTCGNGGNDTKCTCKVNVQGVECEECKSMHFGLSLFNPLGCRPCACDLNGTLGGISSCDKDQGSCLCKDHVTGRDCSRCMGGFYDYRGNDMFGCKRCKCNAGGSFSAYCDDRTGQCTCLPNIAGIHCDRVENSEVYVPDLHHIKFELEDAKTVNDLPVAVYADAVEFPGFSGVGFTVLNTYQTRIQMLIDVPRTTNYHVIVHYTLSQVEPVGALIRFIPTLQSSYFPSGPAYQHKVGAQFKSTATWSHTLAQYLTVKDSQGRPIEVLLSRGQWKLTIAAYPSTIRVDCLVLLPEAYYRPTVLKEHVTNPCEVHTADQHCMHYRFPNMDGVDFVTMEAESGRLTGRKYQSLKLPFSGVELRGQQNVLSVDVPRDLVSGSYVIVASYFHDSPGTGRLDVLLTSGRAVQAGWMKILSCRYTFGCRQVAIDSHHQVRVFTIGGSGGKTISVYSGLSMAVDSITVIPHASWVPGYVSPAPQCVRAGPSCVSSTYTFPGDATLIQAENSTDKNGHGAPRPPYLLDFTIRLAYIRQQQHSLYIHSSAQPGRYYVLVHFFQPQFLSFRGRVIVSSESATPALLNFRYCPFVSGCRAIGESQKRSGMKERITIGRARNVLLTIVTPNEVAVWIDYVLLVPVRSFTPSLLQPDPVDTTQDFIQQCARNSYFIKASASRFCLKSVFAMTSRFNRRASSCDCDRLGSRDASCQSFGGQCRCHSNVVGRTCNRCKPGYRRVPNTRGCVL